MFKIAGVVTLVKTDKLNGNVSTSSWQESGYRLMTPGFDSPCEDLDSCNSGGSQDRLRFRHPFRRNFPAIPSLVIFMCWRFTALGLPGDAIHNDGKQHTPLRRTVTDIQDEKRQLAAVRGPTGLSECKFLSSI